MRINKRQRIPKGQSKRDNPEIMATQGTQDGRKTKNKDTTQYVLDTTIRKQTQITLTVEAVQYSKRVIVIL